MQIDNVATSAARFVSARPKPHAWGPPHPLPRQDLCTAVHLLSWAQEPIRLGTYPRYVRRGFVAWNTSTRTDGPMVGASAILLM